jgi:hypothetical protein
MRNVMSRSPPRVPVALLVASLATAQPHGITALPQASSTVDLVLTPGPALNEGWDATAFTAKVLLPAKSRAR